VIRRIALRGAAAQGIALARADLVPEVTINPRKGVFWHPVGARIATCWSAGKSFHSPNPLQRCAATSIAT